MNNLQREEGRILNYKYLSCMIERFGKGKTEILTTTIIIPNTMSVTSEYLLIK